MTAIERLRALVNRDEPGDMPIELVADALLELDIAIMEDLRDRIIIIEEILSARTKEVVQDAINRPTVTDAMIKAACEVLPWVDEEDVHIALKAALKERG